MASGDAAVFAACGRCSTTFARTSSTSAPRRDRARLAKLLNNLLSATAIAITSEATTLGVRAGLDPATLLDVFNAGSGRNTATSRQVPAAGADPRVRLGLPA